MSINQSATPPRHWDTICLTVVTISTATIGATIVLAGIPDLTPDNGTSSIIKAALAFLAAGFHIALTGLTTLVIFSGVDQDSEQRRQRRSLIVYLLFFIIIILLAGTLIANLFADLVIPLLDPDTPAVHYK